MESMLRFGAAVVMVGLVSQLGGCTAGVWEDARETTVSGVSVEGLEVGPTGRTVLRYGINSREALFALPVDGRGRPAAPFVYRGDKRGPRAMLVVWCMR